MLSIGHAFFLLLVEMMWDIQICADILLIQILRDFLSFHQRTQLKIIQDQQKQLENQQVVGRKVPSFNAFAHSRTSSTTTTSTTTRPALQNHHHPPRHAEVKGEESVIEYDYYYYDPDDDYSTVITFISLLMNI